MRYLFRLALFLAASLLAYSQSVVPITAGSSLPPRCSPPELFVNASAPTNAQMYSCIAKDTWVAQTSTGGACQPTQQACAFGPITLNASQIEGANNVPVTQIATPGSGKQIAPGEVWLNPVYNGTNPTDYSGGAAHITATWGSTNGLLWAFPYPYSCAAAALFTSTPPLCVGTFPFGPGGNTAVEGDLDNQDFVITVNNGSGGAAPGLPLIESVGSTPGTGYGSAEVVASQTSPPFYGSITQSGGIPSAIAVEHPPAGYSNLTYDFPNTPAQTNVATYSQPNTFAVVNGGGSYTNGDTEAVGVSQCTTPGAAQITNASGGVVQSGGFTMLFPPTNCPVSALIAHTGTGGGNTVTTGAVNSTGANFCVVVVADGNDLSTAVISDSKLNTYSMLSEAAFSGSYVAIYYAANATVGSGHTFSAILSSTGFGITAGCFASVATVAPFDMQNGASGSSPGSITPSQNQELLISGYGSGNGATSTIDSGFSVTDNVSDGSGWLAMAYYVQPTAMAINPTWSGGNGPTVIASFVGPVVAPTTVFIATTPDGPTPGTGDGTFTISASVPTDSGTLTLNLDTVQPFGGGNESLKVGGTYSVH